MYGTTYTTYNTSSSAPVQAVWTEDNLSPVHNEEEEMAPLNVAPAKGYTPATAAQRLRVILKSMIQGGEGSSGSDNEIWKQQIKQRIATSKKHISYARNGTRSSNVRAQLDAALSVIAVAEHELGYITAGGTSSAGLKEAYSLVQIIPTIEHTPTGQAESTLRAITAMLKVYWGVDVEATPKLLPDVMKDLLTSIKGAQTQEETIHA